MEPEARKAADALSPTGTPDYGSALNERLGEACEADGFLPFDRFMETALYSPGVGYYERAASAPGPSGDFYTAGQVSPLFAECLAARIADEFRRLGDPERFRVVEVGPGDGTLAAATVRALAPRLPETAGVEYVLVERSRALRERAFTSLEAACRGSTVRARSLPQLGSDGPFEGVVVANELLDALPAERWVARGGSWCEVGLTRQGERWTFAERAKSGTLPLENPPLPVEEGTVFERSGPALTFPREIADHLSRGSAILIDFGASEDELLLGRPNGTLAALRAHRPVEDPLERPGETDLSTFVNFTRLREAARRAGLIERSFLRQRDALGAWGFPKLLEEALARSTSAEASVRLQLAAKNLLFGFENFWVLELSAPGPRRPGATS
ncbi:MAG: SAM-dependent methyltransferase [Thermoplasmata archaeon]|nr:SAM-dependent methyltransferase [Thermoplasmata archaeon]